MVKNRTCFLIFVKYPRPGQVKTRLGSHIGYQQAAQLYKEFVELCLCRYRQIPEVDFTIYYSPDKEIVSIRSWLGKEVDYLAQPEGDLGDRLIYGFENRLKEYQQVIALGTDSPSLPIGYIQKACDELCTHDVVIGPTMDGGYYLIGLSRFLPYLFSDISWSSEQVFQQTKKNAATINATAKVLPTWYDIDTSEDLEYLKTSEDPTIISFIQRNSELFP